MEDVRAARLRLTRLEHGEVSRTTDWVAREEPMEIRVEGRSIAVIMRTPGHDEELAAGFLLTEGVIKKPSDIFEISLCPSTNEGGNVADVLLAGIAVNWESLTRHVFASSSCGVCGKTTLESVFTNLPPVSSTALQVSASVIQSLPDKLRAAQETFAQTGGLHASAIFDAKGELIVLREDVGRHNALDKVLGYALRTGLLPLKEHVLMVSGRVSFEIMQKSLAGGIPVVAAISAPSTLAVEFAEGSGQTLVGFLRGDRMNVYAYPERVGM